MEFKPEEKKYYHDIYHNKYYEIKRATQFGNGIIDIDVRECKKELIRVDVIPIDNFKNREHYEEEVIELIPFGKIKKIPNCEILRLSELQDRYVYKKIQPNKIT